MMRQVPTDNVMLPQPENEVCGQTLGDGLDRRAFIAGFGSGAIVLAAVGAAQALTVGEAQTMIERLVGEIRGAIESNASDAGLILQFERIFERYADVDIIAQSALGPPARSATPAQMKAFTEAFKGYLARKYARRFREFDGGRIMVKDARPLKSFQEVVTTAFMKNSAPFDVRFHVSGRSGRDLFFNIIIEGVNMLATERAEIGAMLNRRHGNIDSLVADLRKAA